MRPLIKLVLVLNALLLRESLEPKSFFDSSSSMFFFSYFKNFVLLSSHLLFNGYQTVLLRAFEWDESFLMKNLQASQACGTTKDIYLLYLSAVSHTYSSISLIPPRIGIASVEMMTSDTIYGNNVMCCDS